MDLGDGEVVDASQSGSILRFVNHSCGPNAETQKWTIQGKQRVGLFATDDILKREEVRAFSTGILPPPSPPRPVANAYSSSECQRDGFAPACEVTASALAKRLGRPLKDLKPSMSCWPGFK